MLWNSLCRFNHVERGSVFENCSCYPRITWMSVALSMCLALRIAVRNSKGKIWKSIWRMTVQIGQSLASSALQRFCGIAWRFVTTFDLLPFGLKRPSFNSTLTDMQQLLPIHLIWWRMWSLWNSDIGIIVEIKCVHKQRSSGSREPLYAVARKGGKK